MKNLLTLTLGLCFLCLIGLPPLFAQDNVGIGTTTPNPRALLDLTSNDKGLLVPRMTTAQRNAIPTAGATDEGLWVYDTDVQKFFYWDGTQWVVDDDIDPTNELNTALSFDQTTKVLSLTDAGGTLTTIVPTTDITDIVAGAGLAGGGNTGVVTLDATVGNGLNINAAADEIRLGGTLVENTTIDQDAFDMIFNLDGTGTWQVQDNGVPTLVVNDLAQVGIGTATPDPSAVFQIESTTQGMLFPTMTTVQRDIIPAPAIGLTIFNSDTQTHQYWNGTCWLNVGEAVCVDYSMSLSSISGCVATSSSSSIQTDVTVTLNSGTAVPILLGVSGLPSGVTVTFGANPIVPTGTVSAIITSSNTTLPGIYNLNFLAIYGTTIQSVAYTLEVVGFSYTVSSTSGTVQEINIAPNTTIATTNIDVQFNGTCGTGTSTNLTVNNLPPGVTAAFSINPIVTNPGTSVLTFTSSSCAEPGTYNLDIVADVGGTILTTPYTLTITESVIDITANTTNFNLYQAAGSPPCDIDLTCNIDAGVIVSSNSTVNAAFNTGPFPSGSIVNLVNNGSIVGRGGQGGSTNGSSGTSCPNIDGEDGGNALRLEMDNLNIDNQGDIFGGGGGGGSGADLSGANACFSFREGGGGGGGAGFGAGGGGACAGANGAAGGAAGGAGGTGCSVTCTIIFFSFTEEAGDGGDGGNYGQPGQDGDGASFTDLGVCSEGTGGNPGGWLKVNGHIYNLINPGNTAGPIIP